MRAKVMTIKGKQNDTSLADLRLYLEVPASLTAQLLPIIKGEILLFFKFYDPVAESLQVGGTCLHVSSSDLLDVDSRMMYRACSQPQLACIQPKA